MFNSIIKLIGSLGLIAILFGQTGTQHGVKITWTAPATIGGSGTIAGYNIYRCTGDATQCPVTSGVWTKIDTALDVTNGYLDQSTLISGSNYSYVSTTVDTNNNESSFSNVATIKFVTITNPNPPTGCNANQQ